MARPRLEFTPEQLAVLVPKVQQHDRDCPADNLKFIRLVTREAYDVTGERFGAKIFRRLIQAAGVQRGPNDATYIRERDIALGAGGQSLDGAGQGSDTSATLSALQQLQREISRQTKDALAVIRSAGRGASANDAEGGAGQGAEAQLQTWRTRALTAEAFSDVYRTELRELKSLVSASLSQLESAQAALAEAAAQYQADRVELRKETERSNGNLNFAMRAIQMATSEVHARLAEERDRHKEEMEAQKGRFNQQSTLLEQARQQVNALREQLQAAQAQASQKS